MERQSKRPRGLEAYGKGGQEPPRAVVPSKKNFSKNWTGCSLMMVFFTPKHVGAF
jgi:hypothetical protein